MALKQAGTSVTVTWKYSGAIPASQSLVVTPEPEMAGVLTETPTAPTSFDEALDDVLGDGGLFNDTPRTITLKKTDRTTKVTDLTPGTIYTFTLKSKKPSLSLTKKFTVLAKPSKPTELELVWQGDGLLGVWDYEGARVKEFVVTYTASGAEAKTLRTGSSDTTFTIPNLPKNVGYTVTVYGTNAAGNGSKASVTKLQAAPNRPSNLVVRPISAVGDSVVVSWEYEGPVISSARVQIKGAGYARDLDIIRLGADARSAEVTGLSAGGTYAFAVTVTNAEASAVSNTEPYKVSKVITAPTGLTATPGNSSVVLKWNAPAGDPENPITGYRVDYSENGSTWRSALGQGTAVTYTIQNLTNGTRYSFRVSALTASGSGLASPVVSAPAGQAPTAPTNLKVVGAQRQLVVSWSAPTAGGTISSYKVEYKTAAATVWSTVDNVTTTTTTISSAEPAAVYSFRVYANGESGWSPASVVVTGSAIDVPGTSTVTATAGLRKVDLKWTAAPANGSPVQGYKLEQQIGDGVWSAVQANQVPTTTFTVNNLTPGQTYRFRVIAINAAGTGPESAAASVTLVAAPDAPTLAATASPGQVVLTWLAPVSNGENVTAYKLERSVNAGSWSVVSETITTLTYTATGLLNGTKYSFRVSARNNTGWSAPSVVAEATPITIPSAPSTVAAQATVNAVRVGWQPITSGGSATGGSPITGYIVSYRTSGGEWQNSPLGPTKDSVNDQIITNLTAGNVYEFRVAAINAAGVGPFSTARSATPFSAPGGVNNLAAVGKSESVELTWSKPILPSSPIVSAQLKYRIEYSVDFVNWEQFELAGASPVTVTGLRNGVPYFVRVTTAYQIDGTIYDGENVVVRATPRGIPDAPQNVDFYQEGANVSVFWDAPANGGGAPLGNYKISYSADGIAWSEPVETGGLSYTFNSLTAGVPYTFRVQSTNVFGASVYSTIELTALALPGIISGLRVLRVYDAEVSLTWNAAPAREGVTGYRVEISRDGTRWNTVYTNIVNTTAAIGSLTNGNTYQFRVSAINDAGFGLSATVSAMPVGPTSVTNLSATPEDGAVTLRWVSPTSGGNDVTITGIQIKYQVGTDPVVTLSTLPANSSTYQVTGLINGARHQFWVTAKTSAGESTSAVAFATPSNLLPDPVTSLTASDVSSSGAYLTWVAPTQSGLGSITYTVEYRLTSASSWTAATTTLKETAFTLTGLTAGSVYEVKVYAMNGAGASSSAFVNVNTGA